MSWRFVIAFAVALLAGNAQAQTVLVCDLGIIADAPFYIGVENGLFAAQHLDVKLMRFGSAADATSSLSTNQIQVAGGGLSAGLFNAVARGWPIRIAMGRTRDMPGHSSDVLMARAAMRSDLHGLADLKGHTIAINASFGALHYMVAKMLEAGGLQLSDVKIVFMPFASMGPALDTGAVDFAAVSEPFAAQFAARSIAFPFRRAADVLTNPPLEVSVVLFSKDWADKNPEQAGAFTAAYLQAVRIYYDAMNGGPQRAGVVQTLMKYTKLPDPALFDSIQWSYMDPDATLSLPSLQDQERWYRAGGALTKDVDIQGMIDPGFLTSALRKMGHIGQ